jgi:regulator of RNase E activity RraA
VFGRKIKPGELIHADKHGFMVIPDEDTGRILEAARFMDSNECSTVIAAARNSQGKSTEELLASIDAAGAEFGKAASQKFQRSGEW